MWNKLTAFWIIKITIPEERWWKTRLHRLFFLINFIVVVTYEYILSKKKGNDMLTLAKCANPVILTSVITSSSWLIARWPVFTMALTRHTRSVRDIFHVITNWNRRIPNLLLHCFLIMWRQSKASSSVCVRYFSWLSINPMSYIDH